MRTGIEIPSPLSVPAEAFARECEAAGMKGGRVGGIARYRTMYRAGDVGCVGVPVEMARVGRVIESESAEGVVRKFTVPLGTARAGVYDKGEKGVTLETESVVIPMIGKKRILTHTLCVSSQVGCAMGCGFCQTAQMGLVRNLTVEEIVRQWWAARWELDCETIRNVVFMGMGEPMDNLEEVIKAVAVLTDRNGVNLPMSKVTISTVGRVDGITRLAEQVRQPGWHRLNLAVSLNAPSDRVRETIMPINRRYSMGELRTALETWPLYGAAKLCLEYVLIPGVNDGPEHAVQLGDYVRGRGEWGGRAALPGLVNVIPYNPREGSPWAAPEEARVDEFLVWLGETGVYAKRRRTKGRDTMAACGQLGNLEFRRKRVAVTVNGGPGASPGVNDAVVATSGRVLT